MQETLTNIADFKMQGFVGLAYPPQLRKEVEQVALSWKRFCDLPAEVKVQLPYSNSSDGVGYELKDGSGNKADRKENFDVTKAGFSWLQDHAEKISDSVVLDFVRNSTALVHDIKPLIVDFAQQVENEFQIPGLYNEVVNSVNSFFIRFIHYFGDREMSAETATAHVDQSGFTPHLFESDPGLECLGFDGKWIPMPVSEGQTVIIPAMQMQLRSQGVLKALCHRVVANPKTAKEGRYSAVCFVQLGKTPKYDKAKWGRLQEMTPGWNYAVSPEEFQKYFKN